MGLDTVSLKGEPFTIMVTEGQQINRGQLIANVDLAAIKTAGLKTDMIVAVTNGDHMSSITVEPSQAVNVNDEIGSVESK